MSIHKFNSLNGSYVHHLIAQPKNTLQQLRQLKSSFVAGEFNRRMFVIEE